MQSTTILTEENRSIKKRLSQKRELSITTITRLTKIGYMMILLVSLSSAVFAQRTCATMDYYELRLQQDPSLAERMAAEEAAILKWMEEHPVSAVSPSIKWPDLPGFTPTGDAKTDHLNYSNAKETYYLRHPKQLSSSILTEQQLKAAREAKSKNKLTVINR